jgi:hypothetical protein
MIVDVNDSNNDPKYYGCFEELNPQERLGLVLEVLQSDLDMKNRRIQSNLQSMQL